MSWLERIHRKGMNRACAELIQIFHSEGVPVEGSLDKDCVEMMSVNIGEWLLARGEIHARGDLRNVNTYLLGRDGPLLSPRQRRWIEQLGQRPLRLYRVTDVGVGVGLTLVDELDDSMPPFEVQEVSGSRSATPGLLMGARIMTLGDPPHEHREMSGAIYPFTRLHEQGVLDAVRGALEAATALGLHPDNVRDQAEITIARSWLAQWLDPMPMPQLRDAGTGEPMLLITDHYRVLNAAALASALANEADVNGDALGGWQRDDPAEPLRSLAAINPGKAADRVEVFYRTQGLEGRARPGCLYGQLPCQAYSGGIRSGSRATHHFESHPVRLEGWRPPVQCRVDPSVIRLKRP